MRIIIGFLVILGLVMIFKPSEVDTVRQSHSSNDLIHVGNESVKGVMMFIDIVKDNKRGVTCYVYDRSISCVKE